MYGIINFVGAILINTPVWVWVMLVMLVRRGWALRADYVFSAARSCIVPAVFALWGLADILVGFKDPAWSLSWYVGAASLGAAGGYLLYASTRRIYLREGVWYATGSLVPLGIVLVNFVVKYGLNMVMSVQPSVMSNAGFEAVYGLAAGMTVGLFVGGIVSGMVAQRAHGERA